jgi:hypothetical protein
MLDERVDRKIRNVAEKEENGWERRNEWCETKNFWWMS